MATDSSVAIAGGGPIGLALALHLDMYGVKSTIFNADSTTRWHPKGNVHNARTMELFRKLGLADKIRALGLPGGRPFDVAYFANSTPSRSLAAGRRHAMRGCACAIVPRLPISCRSQPIASTRCTWSGSYSSMRPAGPTSQCTSAGRSRPWPKVRQMYR